MNHWRISRTICDGYSPGYACFYHLVKQQIENNNIELLPIEFEHTLQLVSLPLHHRDPFDRLIIAQAMKFNHGSVAITTRNPTHGH